jgi:hypothetical protein
MLTPGAVVIAAAILVAICGVTIVGFVIDEMRSREQHDAEREAHERLMRELRRH